MKHVILILLLSVTFTSSCKKEKANIIIQKTSQDTIKSTAIKNIKIKRIVLKSQTKKELKNWKEYQLVDEILSKFNSISNEEALNNAKELSEFVTHLKDSITDKRLKSPPLRSRINILHNECLRLNDMTSIPAISSKEVRAEIINITEAYSAFNAKLNDVFEVRNMENQLELDPAFESILNDSSHVSTPEKVDNKQIELQKRIKNQTKFEKLKRKKLLNNPIK